MNKRIKKIIALSISTLTLMGVGISIHSDNAHANSVPSIINRQVNHMSWRQKVGQMFVGDGLSSNNRSADHAVHNYHLGGVILDSDNFRGNVKGHDNSMQRTAKGSLLIGTDEEGGQVSRLGYDPQRYPSPQEAYHRGGMNGIKKAYGYSAKKLHRLGINWNYAPDADVATPGSYMYFRAFCHGPYKTARYVKNAVDAIQHQKVAATLKHFPGYGSAKNDTDYYPVMSNRSLKHLEHYDFVPFRAGIKAGADSVMVTNIILGRIQRKVPATLSKKDIGLLRNKLHFNGVIVTDSLNAVAVKHYCRTHHVLGELQAVKAGNDMIMSTNFRRAIPVIVRAIKSGKVSKAQINRSVARILTMKAKLGLKY